MSAVITPSTCRHCMKPIVQPAGPVIVGDTKEMRQSRIVAALAEHLAKCQQPKLVEAFMMAQTLQGILIVGDNFQISDPDLLESMNRARYQIHAKTRRVLMPDESIRNRVEQMKLDPATAESVIEVLCQMRDIITEADMEAPAAEPTT